MEEVWQLPYGYVLASSECWEMFQCQLQNLVAISPQVQFILANTIISSPIMYY